MAATVYAETQYVAGVQKITFRTGPGIENKIIKMLETEEAVTVLEAGEEWTKIRDSEGNEGYVLSRFLDTETPYSLRFKWLKSNYDKLKEKEETVGEEKKHINQELKTIKEELESTKKTLAQTETKFEELKTGSTQYIQLKSQFEKSQEALEMQTKKIKVLEGQLSTHYIMWFLAGAGVLFLGWLIGLATRKRKSYGSGIKL